jgi:protein phosphatase PTC2/3
MVTVLALHPSMASSILLHPTKYSLTILTAEFRGPGVRHQFDHDSPDEYELDLDNRSRGFGGKNGRIILLGDGTEVLTESDDTEMFDHSEEDKDTENQVSKGTPPTTDVESMRSEREGTPAPQPLQRTESPSSTQTEESEKSAPVVKQGSDGPRKPDKTT